MGKHACSEERGKTCATREGGCEQKRRKGGDGRRGADVMSVTAAVSHPEMSPLNHRAPWNSPLQVRGQAYTRR
eukprot:3713926-Rhodomonas_salina.1